MKTQIVRTVEVTLTLNEEEAKWLKGLVQNPVYGETPENEHPQNREMRSVFWNALGGDRGTF